MISALNSRAITRDRLVLPTPVGPAMISTLPAASEFILPPFNHRLFSVRRPANHSDYIHLPVIPNFWMLFKVPTHAGIKMRNFLLRHRFFRKAICRVRACFNLHEESLSFLCHNQVNLTVRVVDISADSDKSLFFQESTGTIFPPFAHLHPISVLWLSAHGGIIS